MARIRTAKGRRGRPRKATPQKQGQQQLEQSSAEEGQPGCSSSGGGGEAGPSSSSNEPPPPPAYEPIPVDMSLVKMEAEEVNEDEVEAEEEEEYHDFSLELLGNEQNDNHHQGGDGGGVGGGGAASTSGRKVSGVERLDKYLDSKEVKGAKRQKQQQQQEREQPLQPVRTSTRIRERIERKSQIMAAQPVEVATPPPPKRQRRSKSAVKIKQEPLSEPEEEDEEVVRGVPVPVIKLEVLDSMDDVEERDENVFFEGSSGAPRVDLDASGMEKTNSSSLIRPPVLKLDKRARPGVFLTVQKREAGVATVLEQQGAMNEQPVVSTALVTYDPTSPRTSSTPRNKCVGTLNNSNKNEAVLGDTPGEYKTLSSLLREKYYVVDPQKDHQLFAKPNGFILKAALFDYHAMVTDTLPNLTRSLNIEKLQSHTLKSALASKMLLDENLLAENRMLREEAEDCKLISDKERFRAEELWRDLDRTRTLQKVNEEGAEQRHFIKNKFSNTVDQIRAACEKRLREVESDRSKLAKENERLNRIVQDMKTDNSNCDVQKQKRVGRKKYRFALSVARCLASVLEKRGCASGVRDAILQGFSGKYPELCTNVLDAVFSTGQVGSQEEVDAVLGVLFSDHRRGGRKQREEVQKNTSRVGRGGVGKTAAAAGEVEGNAIKIDLSRVKTERVTPPQSPPQPDYEEEVLEQDEEDEFVDVEEPSSGVFDSAFNNGVVFDEHGMIVAGPASIFDPEYPSMPDDIFTSREEVVRGDVSSSRENSGVGEEGSAFIDNLIREGEEEEEELSFGREGSDRGFNEGGEVGGGGGGGGVGDQEFGESEKSGVVEEGNGGSTSDGKGVAGLEEEEDTERMDEADEKMVGDREGRGHEVGTVVVEQPVKNKLEEMSRRDELRKNQVSRPDEELRESRVSRPESPRKNQISAPESLLENQVSIPESPLKVPGPESPRKSQVSRPESLVEKKVSGHELPPKNQVSRSKSPRKNKKQVSGNESHQEKQLYGSESQRKKQLSGPESPRKNQISARGSLLENKLLREVDFSGVIPEFNVEEGERVTPPVVQLPRRSKRKIRPNRFLESSYKVSRVDNKQESFSGFVPLNSDDNRRDTRASIRSRVAAASDAVIQPLAAGSVCEKMRLQRLISEKSRVRREAKDKEEGKGKELCKQLQLSDDDDDVGGGEGREGGGVTGKKEENRVRFYEGDRRLGNNEVGVVVVRGGQPANQCAAGSAKQDVGIREERDRGVVNERGFFTGEVTSDQKLEVKQDRGIVNERGFFTGEVTSDQELEGRTGDREIKGDVVTQVKQGLETGDDRELKTEEVKQDRELGRGLDTDHLGGEGDRGRELNNVVTEESDLELELELNKIVTEESEQQGRKLEEEVETQVMDCDDGGGGGGGEEKEEEEEDDGEMSGGGGGDGYCSEDSVPSPAYSTITQSNSAKASPNPHAAKVNYSMDELFGGCGGGEEGEEEKKSTSGSAAATTVRVYTQQELFGDEDELDEENRGGQGIVEKDEGSREDEEVVTQPVDVEESQGDHSASLLSKDLEISDDDDDEEEDGEATTSDDNINNHHHDISPPASPEPEADRNHCPSVLPIIFDVDPELESLFGRVLSSTSKEEHRSTLESIREMVFGNEFGWTAQNVVVCLYVLMAQTKREDLATDVEENELVSKCKLIPRFWKILGLMKKLAEWVPDKYGNIRVEFLSFLGDRVVVDDTRREIEDHELVHNVGRLVGTISRDDVNNRCWGDQVLSLLINFGVYRLPFLHAFAFGVLRHDAGVLGYNSLVEFTTQNIAVRVLVIALVKSPRFGKGKYPPLVKNLITTGLQVSVPDVTFDQYFGVVCGEVKEIESDRELNRVSKIVTLMAVQLGFEWFDKVFTEVVIGKVFEEWGAGKVSDGVVACFVKSFGMVCCSLRRSDLPLSLEKQKRALSVFSTITNLSEVIRSSLSNSLELISRCVLRSPDVPPEPWRYEPQVKRTGLSSKKHSKKGKKKRRSKDGGGGAGDSGGRMRRSGVWISGSGAALGTDRRSSGGAQGGSSRGGGGGGSARGGGGGGSARGGGGTARGGGGGGGSARGGGGTARGGGGGGSARGGGGGTHQRYWKRDSPGAAPSSGGTRGTKKNWRRNNNSNRGSNNNKASRAGGSSDPGGATSSSNIINNPFPNF